MISGLNPEPCAVYAIQDRFTCGKCGETPQIKKAEGSAQLVITFVCHGEEKTCMYDKNDLTFIQDPWGDKMTHSGEVYVRGKNG